MHAGRFDAAKAPKKWRDEARIILMNSAAYAMKMLQKEMDGEAEKTGIGTDDDALALVKDVRAEKGS